MGGNALKGFVERKNRHEHQEVVSKVLNHLHQFTSAEEVRYVGDKDSFGDADIVVMYTDDFRWMVDSVNESFNPKATLLNSNVFSFEVDGHQVDLIFTKKEFYESSLAYFANNDMGNLVGRVSHKLGFKYGHEGLVYVMRDGDRVLTELHVSTDQQSVYEFMGYPCYRDVFENFEQMFEYVASSEYFDTDIYLLHNRNHISRVRDAKRSTYNAFLKWCEDHPGSSKFKFPTDILMKNAFKYEMLLRAFAWFPDFEDNYNEALAASEHDKQVKKVFNGNLVSEWTGLAGKELGEFMAYCKADLEYADKVLTCGREWVMKKYFERAGENEKCK